MRANYIVNFSSKITKNSQELPGASPPGPPPGRCPGPNGALRQPPDPMPLKNPRPPLQPEFLDPPLVYTVYICRGVRWNDDVLIAPFQYTRSIDTTGNKGERWIPDFRMTVRVKIIFFHSLHNYVLHNLQLAVMQLNKILLTFLKTSICRTKL